MKYSNSFIKRKDTNKSLNEKLPKNKIIKNLTTSIETNFSQINPLKNKSYLVNQNFNDNFSKKQISFKNISNNKNEKTKNKKKIDISHRPCISTDFALNLEVGNLKNNTKNMDENDINSENYNKLIKVNTKKNYKNNLSLRNKTKTNNKKDKNNKSKKYEKIELIKDINKINILNNKIIDNTKIEVNKNFENKLIYIQKWWKKKYSIKKRYENSILMLIKCIYKIYLLKPYALFEKTFPSVFYFFHIWNDLIYKQKILKRIIHNTNKIKKIKNIKKLSYCLNRIDKISPRNNINRDYQESLNNNKIVSKNNILKNKRKVISIITNSYTNNSDYTKTKDSNNCCQTTKHNNYIKNKISFTNLDLKRNKKSIPYSPKINFITERNASPINRISQKLQGKKSPLISRLKKTKEKKPNKLKKTKNSEKMDSSKSCRKKFNTGEKIIEKKIDSRLNSKINFNNSDLKKKTQLNNEERKGETKEKKILKDENINFAISNKNDKRRFNTDINCNKFNSLFQNHRTNSNSKVFENGLSTTNKFKNFGLQDKNELFNTNILEKKINKNKNKNNLTIDKHVIFHNKREKEKIKINKEFSNHKNLLYNITVNTSNGPLSDLASNISKISSIDNNSIRKRKIFKNKKNGKKVYFSFWKELTDKKNILQKLLSFSKMIYNINHYEKIISLKNSIQEIIKMRNKELFYQYTLKLFFKMIINLMKKAFLKINNNKMREIKIIKKNNINIENLITNFQKGKNEIINNININNYIHYDDYNFGDPTKKERSTSLSKLIELRANNKNSENDYYTMDKRYTLTNSNSDKFIDFCKNKKNTDKRFSVKIYNHLNENNNNIGIKNEILKKNNSGYLNNKIIANTSSKSGNGVIIDQINQLKMVFNLLERHNDINNKNNKASCTLFDCFFKWKINSFNKNKSLDKKITTPRISEKIINLKPFQTSRILNNNFKNSAADLSLKKNFSLAKISPKIINVINVQNYNENNNYNYNFKYMPIKDNPIYPRNSYDYNNINNINIGKTTINSNINTNINNNLNATASLLMANNNKQVNPNIVYHKKKLGSSYICNNYNYNYNNKNMDNIFKSTNFNNYYYKLDPKMNYDNSSFLLLDTNQSQIIFPAYSSRINLEKNRMNLGSVQSVFRDNSLKNIRTCASKDHHPEQKYGFKKLDQIEEKEINFENCNKNKKLYIKKPHLEGKRTKSNYFYQNNNENLDNNLIKYLDIQFGRTKKEIIKNNIINNNKDNESIKYITISEDFDKSKINDKIGQVYLKKKNYNQISNNNPINIENDETTIKTSKTRYQLNRVFSCKNVVKVCKAIEPIKNEKTNYSFEFNPNINNLQKEKNQSNNNTL